jgi:acyl transferase domain-containing protein/phosphopantetheinyl transferase
MTEIAIVGMAALMPGAGNLERYWQNLVDGVDAITDVPAHRWDAEFYDPELADRPDRLYCRRGGFVDELATFEPLKFGVMPASIGDIEPDQLIALEVAAAAIDDAGGRDRLPDADRVGVILGRGGGMSPAQTRYGERVRLPSQVVRILRDLIPELDPAKLDLLREKFDEVLGPHQPEGVIGLVPNLAASRVANRLNLRGPAYTVDAACASSLIAVDQAIAELSSGRLDAVLAGATHHVHDIVFWSVFSQLRALSRQGQIRPFDAAADGLLIGEGTGIVVLKRLSDAERDGDRVYAVVWGIGTSSDGRSASMFNPATSGQTLAIRRAWAAAGLDPTAPDALGLLEAHGTATPTGDAAELTTVAEVFGSHHGGERPVIGSVKSMIGHTMPAAGIAGLIKAALAVYHGVLLPTLHCDEPRAELARTRFRTIRTAQPWEGDGPRRAAVNAFGFGGINAHVVIEQYGVANGGSTGMPATRPVSVTEPEQVLWLSAADPVALGRLLDRDDEAVRAMGAARAAGPAASAEDGRCRLGLIGPTAERLASSRRTVARGVAWRGGRDLWFSHDPLLGGASPGRVAFVFPGLEAEFAPRTADIAEHFRLHVRQRSASDLGQHGIGLIEVGQLLTKVLRRMAVLPDAVAGYSIGEWSAAATTGQVSTGAADEFLSLFDADSVEVAGYRFAVVAAGAAQVSALLDGYPRVVLSHDNTPTQCIVNGPEEEVRRLVEALRRQHILCQLLPFRSAFHTPAFADGLQAIGAALRHREVHPTAVPVWSSTLGAPFPADAEKVNELSVRHMMEPVRFRRLIDAMYEAGFRVFLQMGPGQLASMIDDNLRGRDHLAVPVNVAQRGGLDQLRRVATALWVEGGAPNLRVLDPPAAAVTSRAKAQARRGPAVRLDLGGPLIRMGEAAANLLEVYPKQTVSKGAAPSPARPAEMVPMAVVGSGRAARPSTPTDDTAAALAALQGFAGQSSAAAELVALLRETAHSAASVLHAGSTPPNGGPVPPNGGPVVTVTTPGPPRAPQSPPPAALKPATDGLYRTVLRVSVETMPYLLDHCLFTQPDDWPQVEDRWPVVPATTIVQHMMDAAEQAAPGMRAVTVRDAKFNRWVIVAPAQEVEILVRAAGPDRVSVTFGGFARATVELARDYPTDRPEPWRYRPADERAPTIGAAEMYAERLMFHGPLFQGVTAVHALGDRHVRGAVTTPAPPGALLDNTLHLIGYWLFATQPFRTGALPVALGSVRFFGPPPPVGTAFECVGRVRSIDDDQLVVDTQLIDDGRVWAQIEGGVDRRFDSHRVARPAERFPERYPMTQRQPDGWTMVFDWWTDPVTQDMTARSVLGTRVYADYERQPAKRRKSWLLGRIAAKDAVRFQLWEDGHTTIYPIELIITNDPNGRPRAQARPGTGWRECDVSLAHCAEIAVAIAAPRPRSAGPDSPGVGIDVIELTDRPDSTIRYLLTAAEERLLGGLDGNDGDRRLWFHRFWAAKEAVGKAEGTGLDGRPQRITIQVATDDGLTVRVADRTYRVSFAEAENPPDLPPRRYIVAWTRGSEPSTR